MQRKLCIIADDLTGALDSAVDFTSQIEPIRALYANTLFDPQIIDDHDLAIAGLAIATGTREASASDAARISAHYASSLKGAALAFKKIDSLLRGPWAAEIAACWGAGDWDCCVIAPAFPDLGRITKNGQQFFKDTNGTWVNACSDIVGELKKYGLDAKLVDSQDRFAPGVYVVDATEPHHLAEITQWRAHGRTILWCGSGGLSSALCGGPLQNHRRQLKTPVLGLFGTDHPVTRAQIADCARIHRTIKPGQLDAVDLISRQMKARNVAFVSVDLPDRISRHDASLSIADTFSHLVDHVTRPGTLIVAGGETLQSLFPVLGIESLELTGKVAPGVPRSIIKGGLWDGVDVISKSGAFGVKSLWSDLLLENQL